MSSILGEPAPHAKSYTSFPVTLSPPATGGIILSNFSAGAASITFTTTGGDVVTMSQGSPSTSNSAAYLPIQVASIQAAANVGTVTALWH